MPSHVLVVEDEPDVSRLIRLSLSKGGDLDLRIVHTGADALQAIADHPPQLVVLDLNLPIVSGLEVCRIIRQRESTSGIPVLMLTARASEDDKVTGLEAGADDYLTKPFSPRELNARVHALLRRGPARTPQPAGAVVYRGTHLVADFDAIAVTVDDRPVRLTRREFELLKFLVQNKNRVVSRDRLLERVWRSDEVETRSVDVHVGRLRGKLGPASKQIETVVGLGYRFVD